MRAEEPERARVHLVPARAIGIKRIQRDVKLHQCGNDDTSARLVKKCGKYFQSSEVVAMIASGSRRFGRWCFLSFLEILRACVRACEFLLFAFYVDELRVLCKLYNC